MAVIPGTSCDKDEMDRSNGLDTGSKAAHGGTGSRLPPLDWRSQTSNIWHQYKLMFRHGCRSTGVPVAMQTECHS